MRLRVNILRRSFEQTARELYEVATMLDGMAMVLDGIATVLRPLSIPTISMAPLFSSP